MKADVNTKIFRHLETHKGDGVIALQGGRRSGKTYTIMQWLLVQVVNEGDTVVVASMTQDQGKAGAYDDLKTILRSASFSAFNPYFDILKSPREVNAKAPKRGRLGGLSFRSFQDPETAKGGACDWVFINEANKFTLQQFYDLQANARKGVILDYNPQEHFWVEDIGVTPLMTTWRDNESHLTEAQLKYFADLKERAERDGASAADRYFYSVYYLGEYGEMTGNIFNRFNIDIRPASDLPTNLRRAVVFGDPSALRGADFFPLVLAAQDEDGEVWIVDESSVNVGDYPERAKEVIRIGSQLDDVRVLIESNGLAGVQFIDFCRNSEISVQGWTSRGNKFDRIIAQYQNITLHTHFIETPRLEDYLAQVYDFGEKCEHDDNIDCVASAIAALKFFG